MEWVGPSRMKTAKIMFRSILQSVGAVLLGLVIAFAMVIGIEGFGAVYHPFPPDVDPTDFAVCAAHVARFPDWILAVSSVGWTLTVVASSWTATRLGTERHPAHGLGLGGFLLGLAVFNMVILPYPIGFKVVTFITLSFGAYLGSKMGKGLQNRAIV